MPRYFTWNASSKNFQRRRKGQPVPGYVNIFSTDAFGRIYTVLPSNDECFYLRLLLVNVREPTSFRSLRTINGELCATYREACQRLNLLENDTHWDQTLADAVISFTSHQIRSLFSIIISTCFPSNSQNLWDKYKDKLAEIHNEVLISLEDLCVMMSGKILHELGMPAPNRPMHDAFNREFEREQQYDRNALSQSVQIQVPLLNQQQKTAYDTIINAVNIENGGFFFLMRPAELVRRS